MSKKIRNFARENLPMTDKQRLRILRDTKRLAELNGLSEGEAAGMVCDIKGFYEVDALGGLRCSKGMSRRQASSVIGKLIGLLPEDSPKAKKKAVPKGQMVQKVLSEAKEAALIAAKVAPITRMINDEPLKGSAVIRFKGNNAVGKAWKSLTGGYTWNVPSASGSFDKLEAFVNAFTSVVKDSGFDLEGKVDAVIS